MRPIRFLSPEDLSCVERAGPDFLSPAAPAAAIWRAIEGEEHRIGPLHGISHAAPESMHGFLQAGSYRSRPRYFARFRDALVFPRFGLVMPRPGDVLADSAASVRWGAPRLQGVPGIVDQGAEPAFDEASAAGARVIDRPAVLLGHMTQRIYGHWLMDCLPGILFLREHILQGGAAILAPPLHPWQRASLARLGVADAVLEVADEVVIARDLIFPSFLDLAEVALPSTAACRTFAALAGAAPAGTSRRPAAGSRCLYVSRTGIPRNRPMLNESRLERALGGLGFECVRPERLDLEGQIEAFSAARVIAGPHGSGLANIGFAPLGCVVVDLLLSTVPDPWICRLSAVLGHRYAYCVTPAPPTTMVGADGVRRADPAAGYEVDIERVLRIAAAAQRLDL